MTGLTYDKERVNFNLARLRKGGDVFEVVVDPDKAIEFKKGITEDIKDVLKAEKVFSDVKKGLLSSENKIKELFNTTDILEVAKIILKDGEIQLTSEYRQKLRDEKKKRIIAIISRNGVDPRTNLPHPPARIEAALDDAKIKIDEFKTADEQVQTALKELKVILPIKFEVMEIEMRIPTNFAGKAYSTIKQLSKVLNEKWLPDGSLTVVVEMPAGLKEDFFDKLNSITHGDIESKIIKTK